MLKRFTVFFFHFYAVLSLTDVLCFSCPLLKREPDCEEQPDDNMPPKFKRHLNDDEVTGSIRSERVRQLLKSLQYLSMTGITVIIGYPDFVALVCSWCILVKCLEL